MKGCWLRADFQNDRFLDCMFSPDLAVGQDGRPEISRAEEGHQECARKPRPNRKAMVEKANQRNHQEIAEDLG